MGICVSDGGVKVRQSAGSAEIRKIKLEDIK